MKQTVDTWQACFFLPTLRLKASMRYVSCSTGEFPTLRTSTPSALLPTLSSGCSCTPRCVCGVVWVIEAGETEAWHGVRR